MAAAPRVVSVVNLKGGVGKSTIAVNLAEALALATARQGRGSVVLVDADPQGTAADWGRLGGLPMPLLRHAGDGADLPALVAGHALAVVDAPATLAGRIAGLVQVSHLVLVPVTPSGADLRATRTTLDLVRGQTGPRGVAPRIVLVPSRVDRRTAAGRELPAVLAALGAEVAPAIGLRGTYVDAFSAARTVAQYRPRSPATQEMAALAAHLLPLLTDA